MSKLGSVSAKECSKALTRAGFHFDRQKGSHMIFKRDEPYALVVIPNHKQLATGTLHNIIKDAGLTVDEFKKLLR